MTCKNIWNCFWAGNGWSHLACKFFGYKDNQNYLNEDEEPNSAFACQDKVRYESLDCKFWNVKSGVILIIYLANLRQLASKSVKEKRTSRLIYTLNALPLQSDIIDLVFPLSSLWKPVSFSPSHRSYPTLYVHLTFRCPHVHSWSWRFRWIFIWWVSERVWRRFQAFLWTLFWFSYFILFEYRHWVILPLNQEYKKFPLSTFFLSISRCMSPSVLRCCVVWQNEMRGFDFGLRLWFIARLHSQASMQM